MSGPELHREGLFGSLRSFWAILISVFYTRLSLASTELEEERERLEQLLIFGIAAALFFGMAVFFFAFFLVVTFWDERIYVTGAIAAVLLVASLIAVYRLYRLISDRPTFMAGTLKELRRDLEGLRRFSPGASDEVKK